MSSKSTSITTPFQCLQMKPFPTGFCILVLDSDRSSIDMTESLLASYQYKVIVAERATEALSMVGESRLKIDIVLTELDLPDMDAFKFVEKVLEIRSLPVIVLSKFANDGAKIQCLSEGAEFCYDKPLHEYTAKNLWQFSVCKRDSSSISEISDSFWVTHVSRNANMHIVDDVILENRKEVIADRCRMPTRKRKMKMHWTPELHEKFVVAVDTIGFFAARPTSILKHMNRPELTSQIVASHLQRYRDQMKGKATQTMPLGMTENETLLKMNSELHAAVVTENETPEGSITKSPRLMSPRLYKGIGCGIYNELAQQLKMQEEINHQYVLPDLNLELTDAGTSVGENGIGNHDWKGEKSLTS